MKQSKTARHRNICAPLTQRTTVLSLAVSSLTPKLWIIISTAANSGHWLSSHVNKAIPKLFTPILNLCLRWMEHNSFVCFSCSSYQQSSYLKFCIRRVNSVLGLGVTPRTIHPIPADTILLRFCAPFRPLNPDSWASYHAREQLHCKRAFTLSLPTRWEIVTCP